MVRIQADDSINAYIVATGAGALIDTTSNTIGQIRAGHAIRGRIESSNGDIFAVRVLNVSPLPQSEGISGSILAKGNIGTIYSTGPIGPLEEGPELNIRAGGRIEQIRTSADSVSAPALEKNIKANVSTGVDIHTGLSSTDIALMGDSQQDAPLGLLQTEGDFEGTIMAANVAPIPGTPASAPVGILIGGSLKSTVNIRFNLDHSKIIAQNMAQAFFTIGLRMTGAIVEFRRDQGDRSRDFNGPTFNIGFGDSAPQYENEIRGMTGTLCRPVDMTVANWWFVTPDSDGRTFDGLIRFSTSKGINIRRMTLEITPNHHKTYMPRVEFLASWAMNIGAFPPDAKSSMEAGVVWSGDLLDGPSGNDPSNDYAEITLNPAQVSAVSPTADIWLQGNIPVLIDTTVDLLGEVHVPGLATGQLLRIGEKLGDRREQQWGCFSSFLTAEVQPCPGQDDVACKYPCALNGPDEQNGQEASPRTFDGGVQLAPIGRVIVADEDALQGQVVVNARNTYVRASDGSNALDFWRGRVDVAPSTQLSPIVPAIPTCAEQTDKVPAHIAPVNTYGGGDAGHVPFRIHYESSMPATERYCPVSMAPGFVTAQSLAATTGIAPPIRIRFDGPLAIFNDGGNKPARVFTLDDDWEFTIDRTNLFDFRINPSDPNTLEVFGTNSSDIVYVMGANFATKSYLVVPNRTFASGVNTLTCLSDALIPAQFQVPVADEKFQFNVIYDCNGNHIADPEEIANTMGGIDCNCNHIIDSCDLINNPSLDQDNDGIIDSCENSSSACSIAGVNIPGDFNCNCLVTVQDIFDFLAAWFANDPSADVNHVSNVTVQDIFDFLGAWFGLCPCVP